MDQEACRACVGSGALELWTWTQLVLRFALSWELSSSLISKTWTWEAGEHCGSKKRWDAWLHTVDDNLKKVCKMNTTALGFDRIKWVWNRTSGTVGAAETITLRFRRHNSINTWHLIVQGWCGCRQFTDKPFHSWDKALYKLISVIQIYLVHYRLPSRWFRLSRGMESISNTVINIRNRITTLQTFHKDVLYGILLFTYIPWISMSRWCV